MSLISALDAHDLLWSRAARRISAGSCVVGGTVLVGGVALSVLTYFPNVHLGAGMFVPFFAAMFPVFGWGVLLSVCLAGGTKRGGSSGFPGFRYLFGELPRIAFAVAAVTLPFGVLSMATGLAGSSGEPEFDRSTGTYGLDEHGTVRIVSEAAYYHAVAVGNRAFVGISIAFLTLGIGVAANHWLVRRRFDRHRPEGPAARGWQADGPDARRSYAERPGRRTDAARSFVALYDRGNRHRR